MRRRSSSFFRALLASGASSSSRELSVSEVDTADALSLLEAPAVGAVDLAELHEFLTCERHTRRADPEFRERLRVDLWSGVVRRGAPGDVPRA